MRLGVLDVGSNTVHLVVVDAAPGTRLEPKTAYKANLLLAELLHPDGTLSPEGLDLLLSELADAADAARAADVVELLAFCTSAIRDSGAGQPLLDHVLDSTGMVLEVLTGEDEARLTFLAVRRWVGWSVPAVLVADIGGGSLELGLGRDEEPAVVRSLPLGAGRLHSRYLADGDPPKAKRVDEVRAHVRAVLDEESALLSPLSIGASGYATSKTFRMLARLCSTVDGTSADKVTRAAMPGVVAMLADMTWAERAQLPGVSPHRAPQLLAGAILAEQVLESLDVDVLRVCPWALREGLLLRRLDEISRGEA